jgi:hypothetical protein
MLQAACNHAGRLRGASDLGTPDPLTALYMMVTSNFNQNLMQWRPSSLGARGAWELGATASAQWPAVRHRAQLDHWPTSALHLTQSSHLPMACSRQSWGMPCASWSHHVPLTPCELAKSSECVGVKTTRGHPSKRLDRMGNKGSMCWVA